MPPAVTGIGCICAAGNTIAETMQSMLAGERRLGPPSLVQCEHSVIYPVFEVSLPDSSGHGDGMTRTSTLLMASVSEALADAELDAGALPSLRAGVCLGTSVGASLNFFDFYRRHSRQEEAETDSLRGYLRCNPALSLARRLGTVGPCQTVVNACSSGTDAIGIAASWIAAGMCDIVLAGGTDELSLVPYNGFIRLMITDPSPCRPFDRERKGLNLGEGAAVLVLESEELRSRRRVRARGRILGYGAASDAYHLTAPEPGGRGLKRALAVAMSACGAGPGDIAFINAHGTGTHENDQVEALVLREMLPGVPVSATKGYTGHALGAAGAIEAAVTVACLESGLIPASAGFSAPDPALSLQPVSEPTKVRGKVALSESLAFGGCNSVLVFGNDE